jgi:hypothetical protein
MHARAALTLLRRRPEAYDIVLHLPRQFFIKPHILSDGLCGASRILAELVQSLVNGALEQPRMFAHQDAADNSSSREPYLVAHLEDEI